jgi:hypothetical protein
LRVLVCTGSEEVTRVTLTGCVRPSSSASWGCRHASSQSCSLLEVRSVASQWLALHASALIELFMGWLVASLSWPLSFALRGAPSLAGQWRTLTSVCVNACRVLPGGRGGCGFIAGLMNCAVAPWPCKDVHGLSPTGVGCGEGPLGWRLLPGYFRLAGWKRWEAVPCGVIYQGPMLSRMSIEALIFQTTGACQAIDVLSLRPTSS